MSKFFYIFFVLILGRAMTAEPKKDMLDYYQLYYEKLEERINSGNKDLQDEVGIEQQIETRLVVDILSTYFDSKNDSLYIMSEIGTWTNGSPQFIVMWEKIKKTQKGSQEVETVTINSSSVFPVGDKNSEVFLNNLRAGKVNWSKESLDKLTKLPPYHWRRELDLFVKKSLLSTDGRVLFSVLDFITYYQPDRFSLELEAFLDRYKTMDLSPCALSRIEAQLLLIFYKISRTKAIELLVIGNDGWKSEKANVLKKNINVPENLLMGCNNLVTYGYYYKWTIDYSLSLLECQNDFWEKNNIEKLIKLNNGYLNYSLLKRLLSTDTQLKFDGIDLLLQRITLEEVGELLEFCFRNTMVELNIEDFAKINYSKDIVFEKDWNNKIYQSLINFFKKDDDFKEVLNSVYNKIDLLILSKGFYDVSCNHKLREMIGRSMKDYKYRQGLMKYYPMMHSSVTKRINAYRLNVRNFIIDDIIPQNQGIR